MSISIDEVERIADLARLALTDEEKERLSDQLSAILDYASRLQKIDTANIPATASVLPLDTILRDDEVRPPSPPGELLANAAEQDADMFRVHAVME